MRDARPGAKARAGAKVRRGVVVGGAVVLAVLGLGTTTTAASPAASVPAADQSFGREITRYQVSATLGADGVARVSIDLDFDFGNDPGHGPFLTLPTRQDAGEQDRLYVITGISASSPTGAPAQVNLEDDGSALIVRIGDPNIDNISGVHTYHVEYTVDGWLNPASPEHSGDELYWNVIGPGWEIPISGVTVQVTGPAGVQDAACFAGPFGSTTPCDGVSAAGDGALFRQGLLPVGYQLTAVTGWPGGTFPGVAPILVDKLDPLAPIRPAPVTGVLALVVLALGTFIAVRRVRRVGRDRAYLGLTPGLRPASGQQIASGYRDPREPVSVQFAPPEGVRPGTLGTLVDEKADPVDVTGTLIDLAVRGYLRIDEVPRSRPDKPPNDWTLVRLAELDAALLPFEHRLLTQIFSGRDQVRLSDLRTTFASSMAMVQNDLYTHVTSSGWFRANPKSVRGAWTSAGIGLLVLGGAATFVLFSTGVQVRGLGLISVAVGLVGLLTAALASSAPARTADGTAVLAQALGFRLYLATAEANQIKFEEGEDIFSKYLPYAIVFGLAERWARVFAELAAQGRALGAPGWYVGSYSMGTNIFWATAFASSMDRFQSVATTSLSAPTPGSSGGSGFGGGGFSGGGVGGGGGGGW